VTDCLQDKLCYTGQEETFKSTVRNKCEKELHMKAIEFSTNMQEGAIKIPRRFWSNLTNEPLHVIILVKDQAETKTKPPFKKRFKAVRLDTRGFKFNRDEANER
jgi:hypothetical protein